MSSNHSDVIGGNEVLMAKGAYFEMKSDPIADVFGGDSSEWQSTQDVDRVLEDTLHALEGRTCVLKEWLGQCGVAITDF